MPRLALLGGILLTQASGIIPAAYGEPGVLEIRAARGSSGSQLGLVPGTASDIRQPEGLRREVGRQSFRSLSSQIVGGHMVRVAYVIPGNRVAQPEAIANLQHTIILAQAWFRDQMQRHGFGPKTFAFEPDSSGIVPKIHIVQIIETDAFLRGDLWSRTIQSAAQAGVPVWAPKQIWWLVPEAHLQAPDGTIAGGAALGAGLGSGDASGVALLGSDSVARLAPGLLADDSEYDDQVMAGIGPYPLKEEVSFPWFEGSTFSSISSSVLGAAIHEISHAFGLPHDFRNDQNFDGNLMGNGLRGIRGCFHPDRYAPDYTRLTYGAAVALNVSRYFNVGATFTDNTAPTVSVNTAGPIRPVNGLLNINFAASDLSGLSAAWLLRSGDLIDEMPLSGNSVNDTFTTAFYTSGARNSYSVAVFDVQGNKTLVATSIIPVPGENRAPQPFLNIQPPTAALHKNVPLDSTLSQDLDGNNPLQVEWDFDGDGVFDSAPSTSLLLDHSFSIPGDRLVRARLTDSLGAQTLSTPIAVRVLPASIAGRHVFYNGSVFDGGDPAPNAQDDAALATDKTALLPGEFTRAANYTSYRRGINGLMIDITGLTGTPGIGDFEFRTGNDNHPAGWAAAAAPNQILVRTGAGAGSHRITLTWPDYSIVNQWLQVTVKATANTGLAADDVFYFGNAAGEANGNNAVNVQDVGLAREAAGQRASISSALDFDRSGVVNAADVATARGNAGFTLSQFRAPP